MAADNYWDCVVCGMTSNLGPACAKCGRSRAIATDVTRWARFTVAATIAGPAHGLRDLRLIADGRGIDWAYRNLFPYEAFEQSVYCPRCSCLKSDDVETPNRRSESCTEPDCLCHGDNP